MSPPLLSGITGKKLTEFNQTIQDDNVASGYPPNPSELGDLLTSLMGPRLEPWRERGERGERPERAETAPLADPLAPTLVPVDRPQGEAPSSSSTQLAAPAPMAPPRPSGGRGLWLLGGVDNIFSPDRRDVSRSRVAVPPPATSAAL